MLDTIPWPVITAGGGGWTLFGICMYGFITGRWWVSRREADAIRDENTWLRGKNDHLTDQFGKLIESVDAGNDALIALKNEAKERRR